LETRKSPYQEITTPENLDIHANLRTATWKGIQTLRARAKFFELISETTDPDQEPHKFLSGRILPELCNDLIRTTGSIDGKHRESTTQAVQGQKAPTIALGSVAPPAAQPRGPVGLG